MKAPNILEHTLYSVIVVTVKPDDVDNTVKYYISDGWQYCQRYESEHETHGLVSELKFSKE